MGLQLYLIAIASSIKWFSLIMAIVIGFFTVLCFVISMTEITDREAIEHMEKWGRLYVTSTVIAVILFVVFLLVPTSDQLIEILGIVRE